MLLATAAGFGSDDAPEIRPLVTRVAYHASSGM
jgi:hypothetical protein